MNRICTLAFIVLLFGQPILAEDLLKPPSQSESPVIDAGPNADEILSEPVIMATGVIDDIDVEHGVVTIAHGPVPVLNWPAARMAFQVRAQQLEGFSVGDEVRFGFQSEGDEAAIVTIERR